MKWLTISSKYIQIDGTTSKNKIFQEQTIMCPYNNSLFWE